MGTTNGINCSHQRLTTNIDPFWALFGRFYNMPAKLGLVSVSRGTNLLLDVGPDKHGLIPSNFVDALTRLRTNIEAFACEESPA